MRGQKLSSRPATTGAFLAGDACQRSTVRKPASVWQCVVNRKCSGVEPEQKTPRPGRPQRWRLWRTQAQADRSQAPHSGGLAHRAVAHQHGRSAHVPAGIASISPTLPCHGDALHTAGIGSAVLANCRTVSRSARRSTPTRHEGVDLGNEVIYRLEAVGWKGREGADKGRKRWRIASEMRGGREQRKRGYGLTVTPFFFNGGPLERRARHQPVMNRALGASDMPVQNLARYR